MGGIFHYHLNFIEHSVSTEDPYCDPDHMSESSLFAYVLLKRMITGALKLTVTHILLLFYVGVISIIDQYSILNIILFLNSLFLFLLLIRAPISP